MLHKIINACMKHCILVSIHSASFTHVCVCSMNDNHSFLTLLEVVDDDDDDDV